MNMYLKQAALPTIFHVTHWKAGSQWVNKILNNLFPADLIVQAKIGESQFLVENILPGRIYPTLYLTREKFDSVAIEGEYRKFVVIRDLRDTLISGYFSMKKSHGEVTGALSEIREKLNDMDIENGLIFLVKNWLNICADIQLSWLESGEELIKYEDLLLNDKQLIHDLFIKRWDLPVSDQNLDEVIEKCRFESLTGGRERGSENIESHERKGISGDWKNYFTDEVKQVFKNRYGGLLVATGYESGLDW